MLKSPFLWGAATSSHQIEGYNENNDWWDFEEQGKVEGGARSGVATDHWNRFREDLRLAAELGLTTYRFSVEWSRLEPEEGRWDLEALERYREIIHECETNGLLPMVTVHHFTLPRWLANEGGFTSPRSPELLARLAAFLAREFRGRVPLWCTINEPMVLISGAYLAKIMPPAVYSPKLASVACRNLLRAHALCYDAIHASAGERQGPFKHHPFGVGIAHNLLDFLPRRSWHPAERLFCSLISRFYNDAFLEGVVGRKPSFGIPFLIPEPDPVIEALGRRTVDFIGVNYYTKAYVHWLPNQLPIDLAFSTKGDVTSDLGWAVHPQGLGKMLRKVAKYGLPIYITENGVADREDRIRSEYLLSHIGEVTRAREQGMDVRGYYHWSLLDNFEWIKGFGPRFGLYSVDYSTHERALRPSAQVYRRLIADFERASGL